MSEQKHVTLRVTGMTCAACANRIEKVLNKMDGVEANVNLAMEKATIKYDPSKQTIADIETKIENLGYGVATEKVTLDIEGMTCAACATRIEKGLNRMEGVTSAAVNLATNSAVVEYKEGVTSVEDILEKSKAWVQGADSKRRTRRCWPERRAAETKTTATRDFHHLIVAAALYDDCPYAV